MDPGVERGVCHRPRTHPINRGEKNKSSLASLGFLLRGKANLWKRQRPDRSPGELENNENVLILALTFLPFLFLWAGLEAFSFGSSLIFP